MAKDFQNNTMATGTVTATGAAINISCGFIPRRVKIINETTSITLEWTDTMGAAKGHKTLAAGTKSFISSNGISAYAGAASAAPGFTIGTDSINTNTNVLHYVAER